MDTTQDSRENGGKRRPQTGGQNRASQRPGQSAPEQRPRRADRAGLPVKTALVDVRKAELPAQQH